MSGPKIAAIVLIVAGILGLTYGGFTYTKDTPMWAGIAAIIGGVVILATKRA
jgi:multidrug transporter EmrE-like cation transporter